MKVTPRRTLGGPTKQYRPPARKLRTTAVFRCLVALGSRQGFEVLGNELPLGVAPAPQMLQNCNVIPSPTAVSDSPLCNSDISDSIMLHCVALASELGGMPP
jgi:hypothetical protein